MMARKLLRAGGPVLRAVGQPERAVRFDASTGASALRAVEDASPLTTTTALPRRIPRGFNFVIIAIRAHASTGTTASPFWSKEALVSPGLPIQPGVG